MPFPPVRTARKPAWKAKLTMPEMRQEHESKLFFNMALRKFSARSSAAVQSARRPVYDIGRGSLSRGRYQPSLNFAQPPAA